MPNISFTKENLLERKQLKAGWRKLKVKSVKEGPGKSDPESTVWACIFVVEDGDDIGVPVNHWFTEKQMGRLAEFVKCFIPNGVLEPGKEYPLEDTIGRVVHGYVEFDIQSGFNTIKEFKPTK